MSPIFIDSNIPMYIIGSDENFKLRCKELLHLCFNDRRRLVTSSEILQEICHRYCSINRRSYIQPAFDCVRDLVEHIYPVTEQDVIDAKDLLLGYDFLTSRDALHISVMKKLGITDLMSFDTAFDRFSWLHRIS